MLRSSRLLILAVFLICSGFDWSPFYGEYMGLGFTYDEQTGQPTFGKVRATIDATGIHGEQALAGGASATFSLNTAALALNAAQSAAASTAYSVSVFEPLDPSAADLAFATAAHGTTPPGAPTITLVRLIPDVPGLFPVGLYRATQTADLDVAVQAARAKGHVVYEFPCASSLTP